MLGFIKNKILTYYHEAVAIREGKMPIPRMALIYPTYACNHHCPGCHYKDWNKNHSESPHMSLGQFYHLIPNLKTIGVKAIEFCGGGEPLIHPNAYDMIRYIKSYDLRFGLFTNGSLLCEPIQELLCEFASYVRISIDDETDWDVIKEFIELRNERQSALTIGAKILVNSINLKKLDERITRAVRECNVDYVQIKLEKPTKHPLTAEQKMLYQRNINMMRIPNRVYGNLENTELKCPCWLSPIHTMIDVYGDVYICCYYQFREKSHKIGNVFVDNIRDIWYGSKHLKVINNIRIEECNVFDCRWHKYNNEMETFLNESHLEFC